MCLDDVAIGAYVDLNAPACPPGECSEFWDDDGDLRCGFCGRVAGHR